MKRNNVKLDPLPPGYEYDNQLQAAILRYFGPSTGQYPGNPRAAMADRPSLFPNDTAISYGQVQVESPYGDIKSRTEARVGSPNVSVVDPTPIYQRVFAPPPLGGGQPDFNAMAAFGQPGSPLERITMAQQKTPAAPQQVAPAQPLTPVAGPAPGAMGMSTSPGLAGSGPRRAEPPPKVA